MHFLAIIVLFALFFIIKTSGAQSIDVSNLDFRSADSVAEKYNGHPIENLPLLSHLLTREFSADGLKFRAIFKWVCTNIENDYELFTENQRNRSRLNDPEELKHWNTKMQARMYETLRKRRRTVCTGYAFLLKELCQHAGIKAEIIDGYGRTIAANVGGEGVVNHSWSAVLLEGKWYLCDATWASGVINLSQRQFVKKYDDAYFLSDPEYFIRNHYPIDLRWTLMEENPSLMDFLNGPIIYSNAYKYKILPVDPDQFELRTSGRVMRLLINGDLSGKVTVFIDNDTAYGVNIVSDSTTSGTHSIELPVRPGRHLVHLLINGDAVLTYAVTRKKI